MDCRNMQYSAMVALQYVTTVNFEVVMGFWDGRRPDIILCLV